MCFSKNKMVVRDGLPLWNLWYSRQEVWLKCFGIIPTLAWTDLKILESLWLHSLSFICRDGAWGFIPKLSCVPGSEDSNCICSFLNNWILTLDQQQIWKYVSGTSGCPQDLKEVREVKISFLIIRLCLLFSLAFSQECR